MDRMVDGGTGGHGESSRQQGQNARKVYVCTCVSTINTLSCKHTVML